MPTELPTKGITQTFWSSRRKFTDTSYLGSSMADTVVGVIGGRGSDVIILASCHVVRILAGHTPVGTAGPAQGWLRCRLCW